MKRRLQIWCIADADLFGLVPIHTGCCHKLSHFLKNDTSRFWIISVWWWCFIVWRRKKLLDIINLKIVYAEFPLYVILYNPRGCRFFACMFVSFLCIFIHWIRSFIDQIHMVNPKHLVGDQHHSSWYIFPRMIMFFHLFPNDFTILLWSWILYTLHSRSIDSILVLKKKKRTDKSFMQHDIILLLVPSSWLDYRH